MELVKLGTVLKMQKGKKPSSQTKECKDGVLPYVDIKAFETGEIDNYTSDSKCVSCEEGDVLIVCDGSRSGLVGRAIKGYVGSTLAKLSSEVITADYLFYYLQGKYLLFNSRKKGTGTPHLNPALLNNQEIIVPDVKQQGKTVEKIEELFSNIDRSMTELQEVALKLSLYKQAVVDYVIGDNNAIVKFKSLFLSTQNGISKRSGEGTPTNVLRLADITDQKVDKTHLREIGLSDIEREKYLLDVGDLLTIRVNGSANNVGRCIVIVDDREYAACDHFIRIKLDREKILPAYAKLVLDTFGARKFINENMVSSAGQNTISQTTLGNIDIPLPNVERQKLIIDEIESKIGNAKKLEKSVIDIMKMISNEKMSIINLYYEGGNKYE